MAKTESFTPRDRSEFTYRLTEPTEGPPYTLFVDQWLTRRKRYHVIADVNGAPVFRSKVVTDCFEWFDRQGIEQYVLVGADASWSWTISTQRNLEGTE